MTDYEREQHQYSDDKIQLTTHQSRRQLLVPHLLQTNKDVQHSAQQHVLFDDVCLETKSGSLEHVQIPDGMHHNEQMRKTALRVSPV